ncbi:hypothetical protein HDU97_009297 [Phlyctochytrium planicorne]|nr:hypothetical protein HDU97_009297 [Phlyctochytrium planicorne]
MCDSAETDMNAQPSRVLQGQADVPINTQGQKQAQTIAWRLKKDSFDHIICSDLTRAVQTAEEIKKYHPNVPLMIDSRLREMDLGDLTGMTWADAKKMLKEEDQTLDQHLRKSGESSQTFESRVVDFYSALIENFVVVPHRELLQQAMARKEEKNAGGLSVSCSSSGFLEVVANEERRLSVITRSNTNTPRSSFPGPLPSPFPRASFSSASTATDEKGNGKSAGEDANGSQSARPSTATTLSSSTSTSTTLANASPAAIPKSANTQTSTPPTSSSPHHAIIPRHLKLKRTNLLVITHGGWIHRLTKHLVDELGFTISGETHMRSFPKNTGLYRFNITKLFKKSGDYEWNGGFTNMNSVSHLARVNRGANGTSSNASRESSPYHSPLHSPGAARKVSPLANAMQPLGIVADGAAGGDKKENEVEPGEKVESPPRRSLGW